MASREERFKQQHDKEKKAAAANTLLMRVIQQARKENSRYADHAEYKPEGPSPYMMVHESDTHYGHEAADNDGWEALYTFVMNTPGVFMGFYGDILEGFNPNHIDSNGQVLLEPTEQILSFKDRYLRNLSIEDKVSHMIGRYTNSHLRAAAKIAGIDPYPLLTHGLPIPLLDNGSIITVSLGKWKEMVRGYHNPPRNGRVTNPTGGLEAAEVEAQGHAKHIVAGHYHTTGNAVSCIKDPEGALHYSYALGARKGRKTGVSLPDKFAVSTNGGKMSGPPGAATIFYETEKGYQSYGIGDLDLGQLLFKASNLYTRIRERGKEGEFRSRITHELESAPSMEAIRGNSRPRIEDTDGDQKQGAISWKKLYYSVTSKAPLLLLFASGFRMDSKLAHPRDLKKIVEIASTNPHAFLFCLRQMLDQDVPQHANRAEVTKNLIKMIEPAWKKGKVPAWLYDGIMRYEYWKKPRDKQLNGAYADPNGFMVADYVSDTTSVPLVDNEGEIILSFKKPETQRQINQYRLRLFDVSGSPRNPFSGMLNSERTSGSHVEGADHDLLVGNNSIVSGWLQRSNPKTDAFQTVISPGWLAGEHTVGGKRARGEPSQGGYGAILLPDIKKIIPVSTTEEATYWHSALYFYICMQKMGSMQSIMRELQTPSHGSRE